MTGLVWEGRVNVTPTPPGYCPFFDDIGCHAYMGGRSVDGDRHRPEWLYREDWTTCCDIDTPAPEEADRG